MDKYFLMMKKKKKVVKFRNQEYELFQNLFYLPTGASVGKIKVKK